MKIGALHLLLLLAVTAGLLYLDLPGQTSVGPAGGGASALLLLWGVFGLASAVLITAFASRVLSTKSPEPGALGALVHQKLTGFSVVQDGGFRFVNERFAEMFAYTPEELVNNSIQVADLIDPDERNLVAENLRRRLNGDIEDIRYRYTGLRKTGERIRVEVHGHRVEWEGQPGVVSVHLDVTKEEILQEQAWRAQKLRALGELTGAVAHDFNNLLTTIITPLDLCDQEIPEGHPIRAELEEARAGAERAVALTRQLLAFSRKRIFRPRPVRMQEVIRRAEPMLGRLTPEGTTIVLDLPEDGPPAEVDPSHFEQVLLNLVTNAADAMRGKGEIRIRTLAVPREGRARPDLVLEVADNGRGMDEETRDKVFEPFFTTRKNGTGLGLSTVHGIVTQAGGEISVESQPGEGTTFRIRLPSTDAAPSTLEDETDQGEERGADHQPIEEDVSVLVVDDEEAVRRVTGRVLARLGVKVEVASDAGAALGLLDRDSEKFDILLTDVGLPDMNGVDLAHRARELRPGISVLYMSGHSDEEVLNRMARESSSGFVEKPFSLEDLMAAVRAAMGERRG